MVKHVGMCVDMDDTTSCVVTHPIALKVTVANRFTTPCHLWFLYLMYCNNFTKLKKKFINESYINKNYIYHVYVLPYFVMHIYV